MSISVILTVKDEERTIGHCLDALLAQTLPADEIVVADAGSRDRTHMILDEYAQRYPLIKVIDAVGANRSQGRNRAIAFATSDLIAVTDAGGFCAPDWLKEISEPLRNSVQCDVVSGHYEALPRTFFERCLAVATVPLWVRTPFARFLPSSRSVAFRKTVWARVKGYPEWLEYSEDLLFDIDLRRSGAIFVEAPLAIVYWFQRSSLWSFLKQYFHYAYGDGQALLWPKRHAIRYVSYLGALFLLMLNSGWLMWLFLWACGLVYLRNRFKRILRYFKEFSVWQKIVCMVLVPWIVALGDVAKMIGFPVGLLWRMRHSR